MNITGQIEDYLIKLKSETNNVEILNKIAKLHFENQEFDKSFKTCIKISIIDPTHSNTFNNIGMLYNFKGKEELSIKNFKEALVHNIFS